MHDRRDFLKMLTGAAAGAGGMSPILARQAPTSGCRDVSEGLRVERALPHEEDLARRHDLRL